jgi:hypothetical protein
MEPISGGLASRFAEWSSQLVRSHWHLHAHVVVSVVLLVIALLWIGALLV